MTDMLYFPEIESCYVKEFEAKIEMVIEGKGVVLDSTAFYPRGGGQEADGGYLLIGGARYTVEDVRKTGEDVLHFLADTEGLSVGDGVRGVLDWEERYGNMRMHTAQHLISAIVKDIYGADTVGNQLYPHKARMDFFPLIKQDFDPEKVIGAFEKKISENLSLKVYFEERPRLIANPKVRVNLERLPPHITELRVVEIDEYDVCPCAGTHIRSLGELAPIEIANPKSKGKGRIRMEYRFR